MQPISRRSALVLGGVGAVGVIVGATGATTNLHVHGLHVSPEGNSDNVLLAIEPGATFDYEYQLPQNHPPGVYWYHPHHHGTVAEQVFGGLYGAIIVGDTDPIPVTRERWRVINACTS